MTESQFQQQVIDLAKLHGYRLIYHTHNSRRSAPGFPDLVMINEQRGRALFRELKTETGLVAPAQFEWITGMTLAGLDAAVWRPSHLQSGRITRELRGEA
ncbi:VRR-NUC domain-containing protein [Arthrobacter sp. ISL-72]|nr:VRR-NUC domain-containing protein [Arthrobacter sp. ISL-72]